VLESILRLSHPLIPFITEEIWQRVAPLAGIKGDTIMLQPYPTSDATKIDEGAIKTTQWIMDFILGIRRIRGEMNIAPGKLLPVLIQNTSADDLDFLKSSEDYLLKLGRVESMTLLGEEDAAPESAMSLIGEMKILIPIAGLIDKDAEIARLEKEIQKIVKDLPRVEGKLNNPQYIEKAPAVVIDKEKAKLATLHSSKQNLEGQLEKIKKL
jgi:valyl-tRNA synthetase